jgi:hypothetical protein
MEFHKTSMGKKFYDADLPKLIQSINRLSDALEKSIALREKDIKENKKAVSKKLKAP